MIFRKTHTCVHLALPSFVQSGNFLAEALNDQCANLQAFFSSARKSRGATGERMLFALLTQVKDPHPPFAALSAMGNQLDSGRGWLRVDPVELVVDGGNVFMVGRDHLNLAEEEANAILGCFNGLIEEDHLRLVAGSRHEWYLQMGQYPTIKTTPLCDVISRDIRAYMPQGVDFGWWHKLLTEFQMLLFDHQVNQHRQDQEKPIVNSVWLWGEGSINQAYPIKNFRAIWSECSLAKGMAMLANQERLMYHPHLTSLADYQESGEYLITLNPHLIGLSSVIQQLILLLEGVQTRKINQLRLYLGNGSIYSWKSSRFSYFKK